MSSMSSVNTVQPKRTKGRSRVSNGTRLLIGGDARSKVARRWRDLVLDAEAERGGSEALTLTQRQAIRRWATLAVQCEQMEADLAAGRPVSPEVYGQLVDRADRAARRMGPVRKAPARPTLFERYPAKPAGAA
jgi:hypothetical protein